ncbi:phosphatidylglycerophosphatase A [candidate division KSB1 bacterium]|nr:phosphatidylglycerophosphatase A [candidate division KSB1 bacterium]
MNLTPLIRMFGSALYSGKSPIAPGTAGSLVGLVCYLLIPGFSGWIMLAAIVIIFFIGVWAATEIEKTEGHDAGFITIDEVVGMWISLLFLPDAGLWKIAIPAFFLFRIFDIIKPFPADRSQNLKGGWGVMVDDVFAGIYANLVLQIVFRFIIH